MTMTSLLDGRTAVVTGGAQGIGYAIAECFVAAGARVVIGDLDGDRAEAAAKELSASGGEVVSVVANVTSPEDVESLTSTCVSSFGHLDVFVNNAGITRDATIRKMTLDDFELVIDVHLRGTWLGIKSAAAVMREQGKGSIINMSSISGKVGLPGQTNYSAAKAGIVGMTKAAAKELGHLGIRVNAIQPGLIRTAMTEAMRPDIFEAKQAEVPMGRAGEPSEVATVALFLASELSSYMSGTVLEVGGGRHI
jgi:3-oxoacyl-[acyl-carrier protein] reductase